MLAVTKTPHTEIKFELEGPEEKLLELIKSHYRVINIRNHDDSIPYQESFVYRETSTNRIGGRIKALRRREGLTQEQLAKKSGIRQAHISEIETGKRQIKNVVTAKKFADALGTSYKIFL